MKSDSDIPFEYMRDFLYVISHDFGAHFRHVVEFSKLLSRDAAESLTEEQRTWLNFVQQGGEQSQHMLQGLLTLSRLINRERHFQTLEIETVIEQVISSLRTDPYINEVWPKVLLDVVKPTQGDTTLVADSDDMVFMLSALLSNAVFFQPRSSDHVIRIKLAFSQDELQTQFTVEDNGEGAQETDFKRMVMPLKRLLPELNPTGTGMGLSGVKLLSYIYDGSLNLGASPMGGLSVKLTLKNNNR
jgi:light-regulated signal transduction histidine kinase (bacteriophytochrome)